MERQHSLILCHLVNLEQLFLEKINEGDFVIGTIDDVGACKWDLWSRGLVFCESQGDWRAGLGLWDFRLLNYRLLSLDRWLGPGIGSAWKDFSW